MSRGNKRDKLKGTNGAKFAVFRRLSLRHFGGKPLETADFLVNLLLTNYWGLDFPGDRRIFSTSVGGQKNIAIAERGEENPEILANL